jgi:hypothetical protein
MRLLRARFVSVSRALADNVIDVPDELIRSRSQGRRFKGAGRRCRKAARRNGSASEPDHRATRRSTRARWMRPVRPIASQRAPFDNSVLLRRRSSANAGTLAAFNYPSAWSTTTTAATDMQPWSAGSGTDSLGNESGQRDDTVRPRSGDAAFASVALNYDGSPTSSCSRLE